MDSQIVFNSLIGLAAFLCGWILNNITKVIHKLDEDIRRFPTIYVLKDDYRRDIDDIKIMLRKIFDHLDKKADK